MRIELHQVDAFATQPFEGNPAAVCPLEEWLPDATMLAIAAENQLSETAFLVGKNSHYHLRWFTPAEEVDLCGHATLASAWVVLHVLEPNTVSVRFETKSGALQVRREGELLRMSLPVRPLHPTALDARLEEILGVAPRAAWTGPYAMLLFEDEDEVVRLRPRYRDLREIQVDGWICTAPGDRHDFVQRFFAPRLAVDEDPVTGSAFSSTVPFWSKRLDRAELTAAQISARGGEVRCRMHGDRVELLGSCAPYLRGIITLPGHP